MIKQKANLNFHYSFLVIFYFSLLLFPASKFIYFGLQEGSTLKLLLISIFMFAYFSYHTLPLKF